MRSTRRWSRGAAVLAALVPLSAGAAAQVEVLSRQKISLLQGGLETGLEEGDRMGAAVASIGDWDEDGVADVAVGAPGDDDGGGEDVHGDRGAVWLFFLHPDGSLKAKRKISATRGGLPGELGAGDQLGSAIASLGDLDGDGRVELAVGAPGDDTGGLDRGAVYVLFLGEGGKVRSATKLGDGLAGFPARKLADEGAFGTSIAAIGDLDGDGITELAVGAPGVDGVVESRNDVWILHPKKNGELKRANLLRVAPIRKELAPGDRFGASLAGLGDRNGDGVVDLAVGAPGSDAGSGAVWILFLAKGARIASSHRIGAGESALAGGLDRGDLFGSSLGALGDLDHDGLHELAVGAKSDDDRDPGTGALWILSLTPDGSVAGQSKLGALGSFDEPLDPLDLFGSSVALLTDVDGDPRPEIVVGAEGDDDGGTFSFSGHGATWVLFLDDGTYPKARLRNGTGENRLCYASLNLPFIGETWLTEVDAAQHERATLTVILGFSDASAGRITGMGELLVRLPAHGGAFYFRSVADSGGGLAVHANQIPNDLALVGLTASTQALILGGLPELCNAIDIRIGT